jgi:hypothetical protein
MLSMRSVWRTYLRVYRADKRVEVEVSGAKQVGLI